MAFFSVWKPMKRISLCILVLASVLTFGYSIWSWRVGATIDPFTEQPLFIRKAESGWLIYSVGFDLKDNGGDVDQRDVGIAPLK